MKHLKTPQELNEASENLNISDVSESSKNKQKLFNLLADLGFEKSENDKFTTFKNGDEIFVFPNTELQERHYITTRKQLDMNGWIDEEEFNSVFDFLNYH